MFIAANPVKCCQYHKSSQFNSPDVQLALVHSYSAPGTAGGSDAEAVPAEVAAAAPSRQDLDAFANAQWEVIY